MFFFFVTAAGLFLLFLLWKCLRINQLICYQDSGKVRRDRRIKSPPTRTPESGDEGENNWWKKLKKVVSDNGWPFFLGALTATATILALYIIYNSGDGKPPSPPPGDIGYTRGAMENISEVSRKALESLGMDEYSWEADYVDVYSRVGTKPQKDAATLNAYFSIMEQALLLYNQVVDSSDIKEENWEVLSTTVNWLVEAYEQPDVYYMRLSHNYYLELKSNRLVELITSLSGYEEINPQVTALLKRYNDTVVPVV